MDGIVSVTHGPLLREYRTGIFVNAVLLVLYTLTITGAAAFNPQVMGSGWSIFDSCKSLTTSNSFMSSILYALLRTGFRIADSRHLTWKLLEKSWPYFASESVISTLLQVL